MGQGRGSSTIDCIGNHLDLSGVGTCGDMGSDEFLSATLGSMDLVHNLARKMTPDRALAEDLVQDTYLAAFSAWKRGKRPRKAEPWMATICLNLGRSRFRRLSRRPDEVLTADPDETLVAEDDPAEAAVRAVRREDLHRAMWDLPEEQRIAIALMDLCGFSASETAQLMRSKRGTVLSRVHRGRKTLATLMQEEVSKDGTRP